MAFTPEGMFYLGKEDVEPTIGLAGQGIRGMLGVQNEEEAVKSLMAEADFSTSEGKEAFLQQLQSVSPDAYTEFSKQFLDYDTKMFAKQSKITKANTPSKDSYDEAGNLMFGHLDTPGMQEQFMRLMYPKKTDDEIEALREVKGFNAGMTARLKHATKSFSRYIEGNYKDKESLNTLLANPTALMDEFKKFSGSQNEYIKSLSGLLITAEPSSGFTKTTTDGGGAGEGSDDEVFVNNAGTLGVTEYQVNKDDSQNQQREQKRKAETEIYGRLHKQVTVLNKDLVPWTLDSNLPASDLKKQQDRDATLTWLTTDGYNYFQGDTTTLEEFESDPVGWWIENIKDKDAEVLNALGL
jgi:hypothetical protein